MDVKKYIKRIPLISKVLIISAICCITICMGILFCYSKHGVKVVDTVCYYDTESHFHYYYGLAKPVSCILYTIVIFLIIIMIKLIRKCIFPNQDRTVHKHILNWVVYILIFGALMYGLLDYEIGHIITSENGFYIIENSFMNSNFKEYSYSYFNNHFPQLLGQEVFFCEVHEDYTGWKREQLLGYYSENIYKLMNELDHRTEYKYRLISTFKNSKQ